MGFGTTGGKFIISLDFELMWGVRDIVSMKSYGANILGVHQAIPAMLECFNRFDIRATFSTVGFLFFDTKKELMAALPYRKPQYKIPILSPYGEYMDKVVGNDSSDQYHFAPHLIKMIKENGQHEIGTHTFSHYYCLEESQTLQDFREDLAAAVAIANKNGIAITSIVFPRNQINVHYLKACEEAGIVAYRSNEESWLYLARTGETESLTRRAFRLMDAYINLTGHHCYDESYMKGKFPVNIPSSRFLRPYYKRFKFLDWLRLRRIKYSMTHAAKNKLMYHLWWHPHNFGINQKQNFDFLEKILLHYQYLHKKYGFSNCTMTEMAQELLAKQPGLKGETSISG